MYEIQSLSNELSIILQYCKKLPLNHVSWVTYNSDKTLHLDISTGCQYCHSLQGPEVFLNMLVFIQQGWLCDTVFPQCAVYSLSYEWIQEDSYRENVQERQKLIILIRNSRTLFTILRLIRQIRVSRNSCLSKLSPNMLQWLLFGVLCIGNWPKAFVVNLLWSLMK